MGKKEGDKTSATEHQSKLSSNSKAVVVSPEVEERVSFIKSTINQLVKEYKDIQNTTIEKKENSLSSYLKDNVKDLKFSQAEVSETKKEFLNNSTYGKPIEALNKWNNLVSHYRLRDAISRVENDPKVIGDLKGKSFLLFSDQDRKEALKQVRKSINTLVNLAKARDYLKVNKQSVDKINKQYNSILKQTLGFKTRDISILR